MALVYVARTDLDPRVYVGATKTPLSQRRSSHIYAAKHGAKTIFARHLAKYGPENFTWEVAFENEDISKVAAKEVELIRFFGATTGVFNTTGGSDGLHSSNVNLAIAESRGWGIRGMRRIKKVTRKVR